MSRTQGTWQSFLDNNICETINNILEKEFFPRKQWQGSKKTKKNNEQSEQDSTMNVATSKTNLKEQ